MEKNIITDADIAVLINASRKLEKGGAILGTLQTEIINKPNGSLKVVKTLVADSKKNGEIINFPAFSDIIGEDIKGKAIIDAFKKVRGIKGNKMYNLTRNFFNVQTKKNLKELNSEGIMYCYDEFGRIYITSNGKRLYLDKTKKHCLTEDGYFADITIDEDGDLDIIYHNSEDAVKMRAFIDFEYLYVSINATKRGEALINEYALNLNKIIDLEAYRKEREERGSSR